jgi:hypothetical protein
VSNGRQCSVLAFEDVELPRALADLALRIGCCIPLDDDRRKHLKGARGGEHPNLDAVNIVDLDAIEEHSGARFLGPNASGKSETPAMNGVVRVDPVSGVTFTQIDCGPTVVGFERVSEG